MIDFLKSITGDSYSNDKMIPFTFPSGETIDIYPGSINKKDNNFFIIARKGQKKYLYVISEKNSDSNPAAFQGEVYRTGKDVVCKKCPMNHKNALQIRKLFDFTNPVLLGIQNSFGYGDRIGTANPAHIRSLKNFSIKPVLAQQSIRELTRTERTPEDVIDSAVWAVFQEGYKDGFGADADHLKTTDDIDIMIRADFTMFTIDPGDFVVNNAAELSDKELTDRINLFPWNALKNTYEKFLSEYENKSFKIASDFIMKPSKKEIMLALVKYGNVIVYTVKMFRYIKNRYPEYKFELELSVDETDSPTTPFEHFLIVNELKRQSVEIVSLAPRFIGVFEKGIDYIGSLSEFEEEYLKHAKIAEYLGPYKISFHSGSDKFSVYEIAGKHNQFPYHVKTAGTSYLEALRTVARKDPGLYREILSFSKSHFLSEKKTYHISADLNSVPDPFSCSEETLLSTLDQNDSRQVLHVAFGKVLTEKSCGKRYKFKDRILLCLEKNEETHYDLLNKHFIRHLKPLFGTEKF